jgi:hypothetical protein
MPKTVFVEGSGKHLYDYMNASQSKSRCIFDCERHMRGKVNLLESIEYVAIVYGKKMTIKTIDNIPYLFMED